MSNDYQTIQVEKRGQVDWLTLNRPEALNSISVEMVAELNDYFGKLYHDRDTRIVVMRGAGRARTPGVPDRRGTMPCIGNQPPGISSSGTSISASRSMA